VVRWCGSALIGTKLLDDDGFSASVVLTQRQAVALLLALGGALGIEIEPEPPTAALKRAFLRLGGSVAVSAAAARARALHLVRSATRWAAR
jgi:hypothetical protein